MNGNGAFRFARILAGLSAVTAIAGCAGQPVAPREGAVLVARIERADFDSPPEAGLFRVIFDDALAAQIRRQAVEVQSSDDVGYVHAEIRVLEREADRELKARGLCSGSAKFLRPLDGGGGGQGAIGALFKCRASLF